MTTFLQDLKKIDEETGHFGQFGGRFVPEALISALDQLEDEYLKAAADPKFNEDFQNLLKDYVGRPSPLTEAKNFSKIADDASALRNSLMFKTSTIVEDVYNDAPSILFKNTVNQPKVIAQTTFKANQNPNDKKFKAPLILTSIQREASKQRPATTQPVTIVKKRI